MPSTKTDAAYVGPRAWQRQAWCRLICFGKMRQRNLGWSYYNQSHVPDALSVRRTTEQFRSIVFHEETSCVTNGD